MILEIIWCPVSLVKRPDRSGLHHGGGGGVPAPPVPLRAGFGGVPGGTPTKAPHHTLGTAPNTVSSLAMISRSLSPVPHTLPLKIHQVRESTGTPFPLSSARSCGGWPGWRGLWGSQTNSATSPYGATILARCQRIIAPSDPTPYQGVPLHPPPLEQLPAPSFLLWHPRPHWR